MPATPAFWMLKKEDSLDFKVNLNYRVRPCLKMNEPEHLFNVVITCLTSSDTMLQRSPACVKKALLQDSIP